MAQKAFTTITPVDTSEIEAVAALAKHCSNDTWRETKRILELRAAGWNMERIAKQLGISRPTAYRRLSDLTEVIASSEELCAKDAIRLVGETLAELHDLRCETMRQADADKLAVRNGGDPKPVAQGDRCDTGNQQLLALFGRLGERRSWCGIGGGGHAATCSAVFAASVALLRNASRYLSLRQVYERSLERLWRKTELPVCTCRHSG
jgi:AraC-like DNA-binding protein